MTSCRKYLRSIAALILLSVVLIGLVGCKEEPPASLYNPSAALAPAPSITGIAPPAGSALAGVTVITITGANFSSVIQNDYVYFDATPATILQASPTQLSVRPPNLVKDSIKIRVAVVGAESFSNTMLYKLLASAADVGQLASSEEPYGIACDAAGNVYASLLAGGLGAGVKKITPDGVRSDFSPQFSSSVNRWAGMKVGPGGFLYTVARNIIFRIPIAGGSAAPWTANVTPSTGVAADLDFDALGDVWVGGTGANVVSRVRVADKNVKTFPFTGAVRSVRVFGGYLYLGARVDSTEGVWRLPILTADSLGPVEQYFNLSSLYGVGNGSVYAVTFAADGDMYIGTDNADGILIVHPSKSSEPLYPGVIKPRSLAFAWDTGTYLYVSRNGGVVNGVSVANSIVKINMLKTSAPYYGLQ